MLVNRNVTDNSGPRHRVVHERRREQLAAGAIVYRVLAKHLSGTLHDAAVDLPFDQQRRDDIAGVVDDRMRNNFDRAGIGVDLHLGDVAAIGKGDAERAFAHAVQGVRNAPGQA